MTGVLHYSTNATPTTLSVALSSATPGSTGSVQVASITGWPTVFPATMLLDWNTVNAEVVTLTQAATGSGPYTYANAVRGDDGSSAPAHSSGASVTHGVSARDFLKGGSDWLNVVQADYGADPSGTNDSTTAIQAAINSAAAGQVVYFPQGTYKTSAPITVPPGVRLVGTGSNVLSLTDYGSTIKPSASWAQGAAAAAAVILLLNQTDGGYSGASEEQQILGLQIDGTSLAVVADGIQALGAVNNVLLRDVTIDFVTGNGVNQTTAHAASADTWRAQRVLAHRAGLSGFVLLSPDSTWTDCLAIGCGQTGGTSNTQPAWSISTCSNSHFTDLRAENTSGTGNGYTYTGANSAGLGCTFTACSTNGNGGHGFEITQSGGSPPVSLVGCRFTDDGWNPFNTGTGGGNFAGIFITAANSVITITGCVTVPNTANAGNAPQYGLRITSSNNSRCRIAVSNSMLWGASAGLSNDASCPLLTFDSGCVFSSGTGSSPVYFFPATTMVAASGSIPLPTTTADLYLARTNATSQTVPRSNLTASNIATNSGTVSLRATYLPAGVPVNNIGMRVGSTAKTGGTHGWYVLTDNNRVVQAVSADQTDAATVWGTIQAEVVLPVLGSASATYVTTYSGLYYAGVMVAQTAGTNPNFWGGPSFATNDAAASPSLGGNSSTGQTTPPSVGGTLTAISGVAASNFYIYTT